ncbi:formate dehydrogenase accessory sulfurtransferase FdhD [Rhodoferax sp.]|uniref:formate dehydrogenase accessory sulfurtransferase FdhD n=1 Tax=Rhodoferax sp. TaxID=50421 RepID=UPI002619B4DA|nr:formate dehydrogenase accessory sulfurtransferase FdhD [Rhodoferax sp.]MDD2925085.1 formate dehydrogenase accessory sulfurtransferase FdhD [Rhodoferax sp.]
MDMAGVDLPASQACRVLAVNRLRAGQAAQVQDRVAEEVPVALEFNGVSHAVMMATPADLEDFAYGFALTEGIVDTPAQIHDCEWTVNAQGCTVQLTIAAACFARLKERRRNLTGRTGCGLCGTESLAHAVRPLAPLSNPPCFEAVAVTRAMADLREHQLLSALTGATHAAAWCTADGQIELIREDVGRHNALDKLVGALRRSSLEAHSGFALITSRASYEMVQKTATAGIGLLAAVSGVTGLAVDVAHATGLTLLGFTRGNDLSIYSHPERLSMDSP